MGSGRVPAPPQPPPWGRIAGIAEDPARGRYRRSGRSEPAACMLYSHRVTTPRDVTGATPREVSPQSVDARLDHFQMPEIIDTAAVWAQRSGVTRGVVGVAQVFQFHQGWYGTHHLGPDDAVGQCFFPRFGFDSPVAVFFDAPGPRPAVVVAAAGCFDQFRECPVSHGVTVAAGSHGW